MSRYSVFLTEPARDASNALLKLNQGVWPEMPQVRW